KIRGHKRNQEKDKVGGSEFGHKKPRLLQATHDAVAADIQQPLRHQAKYQQAQRIDAEHHIHVSLRPDWRVIDGIIEIHELDDAQVVESAHHRHQHDKYHEPDKPCLQGGLQHNELGVETQRRRNARHGEHGDHHEERMPWAALVQALEI